MVRVARIVVYPIKSLDGVSVEWAEVLPSGALRNDRRFALCDTEGNFLNGKRDARMHLLRAAYDLERRQVTLGYGEEQRTFSLSSEQAAIGNWLSQRLGQPVSLIENDASGFPDDVESPGPTVISGASLRQVASWFEGLDEPEVRHRFRANLELAASDGQDLPPFWEDRLCGPAGSEVRFRVGSVVLAGTNPCQRCIVPTRDSTTGQAWPLFAKSFAQRRQDALPDWAERTRFDHFYRLAVNTRMAGEPGVIHVGDAVEVIDET